MSLPDLSKWHEVPRGTTLTKGTKYVVLYVDGSFVYTKVYNKLTLDEDLTIRVFTEEPVERSLADVLRDAYLADEDWDNVAAVAQEWFAKQPQQPRVIIDNDTDLGGPDEDQGVWRLNQGNTYDFWYGTGERSNVQKGYTRKQIEKFYGIQEERY